VNPFPLAVIEQGGSLPTSLPSASSDLSVAEVDEGMGGDEECDRGEDRRSWDGGQVGGCPHADGFCSPAGRKL